MTGSSESRTVRNYLTYALLVGVLAAVHFVLAANPQAAKSAAQAAVFGWKGVGVTASHPDLGLQVLREMFCLTLSALPGLWEAKIGLGRKVLIPVAIGLVLGAAQAATDHVTNWGAQMAAQIAAIKCRTTIHIALKGRCQGPDLRRRRGRGVDPLFHDAVAAGRVVDLDPVAARQGARPGLLAAGHSRRLRRAPDPGRLHRHPSARRTGGRVRHRGPRR